MTALAKGPDPKVLILAAGVVCFEGSFGCWDRGEGASGDGGQAAKDACHVAITWTCINARRLVKFLTGSGGGRGLLQP